MGNQLFREATRNIAFQLTLSQNQIDLLFAVYEGVHIAGIFNLNTMNALMSRGLVYHEPPSPENPITETSLHYFTTRAGALVVELLQEADF